MNLNKISKHCYYTDYEKERDRPTLGYIYGDKYSLMVDAGTSQFHVAEYNNLLKEEGLKNPTLCLITHWHWDHTYGMHGLDITSVVLDKTNESLKEMMTWVWDDQSMKKRLEDKIDIQFADEHIRKEYLNLEDIKVVSGDVVFTDSIEMNLGNVNVQIQHVPSSHSDDSVIIYVKEDRVVYVGDAISVDYYNDNYLDKEKMGQLRDILVDLDFDLCITGHNDPVSKEHLIEVVTRLSK